MGVGKGFAICAAILYIYLGGYLEVHTPGWLLRSTYIRGGLNSG